MLLSFTQLRKKYSMDIKGIIHVGAHYGEEIEEYVNNGIQEIILFEPLGECFEILQRKIFDLNANIAGYQVALGSSPGTAEMYISDNQMQSSSILKPKVHLTHHPHVKFNGTEEVEVDMLDNFDTKDYNFLNMDVQGYELEVLKGGTETLKHVDYVYCEVNRDELYEGNAYIRDIDDFLSKYDMIRVETNWEGDLWGDALYIKKMENN
jgi:FkbM family methyltransferase